MMNYNIPPQNLNMPNQMHPSMHGQIPQVNPQLNSQIQHQMPQHMLNEPLKRERLRLKMTQEEK